MDKVFEIKRYDGLNGVGRDLMTHELEFHVLIKPVNNYYKRLVYSKMWRSVKLNCQVYLTQGKRFSLGFNALEKWMNTSYVYSHLTKADILNTIKNIHKSDWKNYVPFETWYTKISENKCFYIGNPKYQKNYFGLTMTDAMLNNIHKKLFTTQNTLWVDQVNWGLTDLTPTKKEIQDALPSEIWTS